MIYDPLYKFLLSLGVGWLLLSIGYATAFILAMVIMLGISGGRKSIKEYLKDPLGTFIWPFFVLAPITSIYLQIGILGSKIYEHFRIIGLDYRDYSLRLDQWKSLFWVLLLLSCTEGIESLLRYFRKRPNLWLSKPKFLQPISTVLFNIPLGLMILATAVRLIDQWAAFHNFMSSGWLPDSVYNVDEMYGVRWLYSIIVTQMVFAVLVSFGSLLILIREGKQKYSWIYKAIFLLCILAMGVALFILFTDMHLFFSNIYSHFLGIYFSHLDQLAPFTPAVPLGDYLQKMLLLQEISIIRQLPRDMPIPNWLSGIIGIRLIILIPEVYTILAKPLGWKKFPLSIEKILKSIG